MGFLDPRPSSATSGDTRYVQLTQLEADPDRVITPGGTKLVVSSDASYVPLAGESVLLTPAALSAYIRQIVGQMLADATPPAPPTGLTATAGTVGLNLSWTAPTATDLFRYDYRIDTASSPQTDAVPLNGTATTATVTNGVVGGTSYYVQVRAVDFAGNTSGWSNTAGPVTASNFLFASDFNGVDGADAGTITGLTNYTQNGSVHDIRSNALRYRGSQSSYTDGGRVWLKNVSAAAFDLTFDVAWALFDTANVAELCYVFRHGEGAIANAAYIKPYNGYYLSVQDNGISLKKWVNGTSTTLTGSSRAAWPLPTANALNRVRLKAYASTIQLKVWDPSQPEPTAWTQVCTDTSFTAGAFHYFGMSNGPRANGYRTATLDSMTVSPATDAS
jgi:hypothetical protein